MYENFNATSNTTRNSLIDRYFFATTHRNQDGLNWPANALIVHVVEAAGAKIAARKNSPLRDEIVSETTSGAKKDRPEFQALKACSAAGPKHFPAIKSKSPELENPAYGQLSGILRII